MMTENATTWARALRCTRSGEQFPIDEPAFLSPVGAPLEVEYDLLAPLKPAPLVE